MSDHPSLTVPQPVRTTCPYCGVGCGVLATLDEQGVVSVRGDPDHPANRGRLCSKGTALGETAYLDARLLYPEMDGEQVSWEAALSATAGRLGAVIDEHGPDAVAFYVSGQLLTEDYYVANKLMKGFIGSANIDTNSRLCMSSAVAAHKRAFGEDVVPCCYEDLERAKLVVLVGSNTAWCHPVLFQRIAAAKQANPDLMVVSIDPRHTQTAGIADLHLALRPGTDSILFNGLLVHLDAAGEHNALFTEHATRGMEAALAAARDSAPTVEVVSERCGLSAEDVMRFYRLFARTERTVTVFSQGVNQSSSGVDKINAIINCHLFTGRIGRPGMGPFSLTGQPNAMGGREVGGLANQLAAHLDIDEADDRERVRAFWNAPAMAAGEGLKAVDLLEAIHAGRVKAVWIMATNPVVSLPDAERVKAALQKCELVVVSDCVRETDTVKLAHIRLPATTWGEREGTVTNSERRISRQRAFLPAPGLARPDWWIVCEVARRMGFGDAFDYRGPADIFREHARLSGLNRQGRRRFDIAALADLDDAAYTSLAPVQWPVGADGTGTPRLYGDGRFSTADGRARFVAVEPRAPAATPTTDFPFVLNTGRVRDHWHTMTRTGMSPRLSAHTIEPYAEIHPEDALQHGIGDAELVEVYAPNGESLYLRARLSTDQQRGSLFVPIHWNDQFSSRARVDSLVPAICDPLSGQPEFKHGVAAIRPCQARWYGFLISRRRPQLKYARYWTRSRGKGFWRYEAAGEDRPEDWSAHARALLDVPGEEQNWVELHDRARGRYRGARFVGERLDSCIFISAQNILPPRDWLIGLFQKDSLSEAERAGLLRGTPPPDQEDTGRIVCACFNVGEKTLQQAIAAGADSVEAIGERLRAGTNCGSCKPELAALIRLAKAGA